MLAKTAATAILGAPAPRLGPPLPLRHGLADFRATAKTLDIDPMPWQDTAATYLTALDADDRWLFREVAIIVSRQNGKTTLLIPLIVGRLLKGHRIMHTAQNRELPREVFYAVAEYMWSHHSDLFPQRNDRATKPRYANGQEEVRLTNGGIYSIVAPTRGGARGPSRDLVIIDEVRELEKHDFIAAAKPTLTASKTPQTLYLSNAGDDASEVLNAIRARAGRDEALAYLEWSAAPDRPADDPIGWAESNPAMGHEREGMGSIYETLVADYRADSLGGTLAIFETEHLCRWVPTMRERLVDEFAWAACESREALPRAGRPYLGVSMDPDGSRGSAALAWQDAEGIVNLQLLYDVREANLDVAVFGAELRDVYLKRRVVKEGHDPMTDAELAKFFAKTEPISGAKFANASANFVNLIKAGRLRWYDCAAVGDDLTWTARKEHEATGVFQAVRADDDRPITAALAAIRAVSLASGPRPPRPRIF